MRFVLPIFANLVLLLAAFGLGGFLRPLLSKTASIIDRLSIIVLGGLGLLGITLFLIGLVHYSTGPILVLLLASDMLGARCLLQETRDIDFPAVFRGISFIPVSVVTVVLMITIVSGLAEPVGGINLDTISYHYLGPRVWLRDAAIRPVLDHGFTAFPATVEVQYGALMAIGGPTAPELFSVISLCVFLLIAAATALRMGLARSDVWWVAALLCTMPAVYRGIYGGMIDAMYAGFILAAARIAFDARKPGHAALVGLFCGFAMGTKYTGLVSAFLLMATAVLPPHNLRDVFSKTNCRKLALICLLALIVAAPWYIRNWLSLGCPMYPPPPFFYRFFNVPYFPSQAILQLHRLMAAHGSGMGRGFISLLLLPLNLTFHPANFESGAGGIGLVPLAFLPFCFRAYAWDAFAKSSALFGLFQIFFWFYTMQESRYLIQVYVLAAIFGVAGWRYIIRTSPRFGPILSALCVAVSISYGLFMIVQARADAIHATVSPSFAERRREFEVPFVDSFRYLNNDSSVGSVLILDPQVPPYYLEKSYIKPFGKYGERPLPGVGSPKEALRQLSAMHITHILDVRSGEHDFQVTPEEAKTLVMVFEEKGQRIYRVSPRS